jgi:hypothetical protein
MTAPESWINVVFDVIYENYSDTFTRQELLNDHLQEMIRRTGTIGGTPSQTISNRLQLMRNNSWLEFLGNGHYRLTDSGRQEYVFRNSTDSNTRKKADSRGEEWCTQILSQLYDGYVFIKIRLDEFKNPETNRALELDFYCKELNLAIEYNGRQHYEYIKFFHQTMDKFEKQKIRDLIKGGYCDIFNIELIEIPNLQSYEETEKYIIDCLEARKIPYNMEKSVEITSSIGDIPIIKKCFKCGEEKSLKEFHADKRSKDGRRGVCKICRNNADINELPTEKLEQSKTCAKCGEEKSLKEFHVDKRSKDGRRGACKSCRTTIELPVENNEILNETINIYSKFDKICSDLVKISEKYQMIASYVKSPILEDLDLTTRIHDIVIEQQNKAEELENEYQNILQTKENH